MSLTPLESLQSLWPPNRWRDVSVVVGVSGGADSIALLGLMHQLAVANAHCGSLIVAHFNHRLRGNESDRDEAFVRGMAANLGLRFEVGHAPHPAVSVTDLAGEANAEMSAQIADSEEVWREQRYVFLEKVACEVGARYVALAHHADDRLETVLHHLFRGTGITGLASLKPFRNLGEEVVIARPLLLSDREAIRDFLAAEELTFREDQSNLNNRFTRNKIRNQLSPFLDDLGFIHHRQAVLRLSEHAAEIEEWLESLVEPLLDRVASWDGNEVQIDCVEFFKQHRPLQRHALSQIWKQRGWPMGAMNSKTWQRLFALINSPDEAPAIHLPGGISAWRVGGFLKLRPLKS